MLVNKAQNTYGAMLNVGKLERRQGGRAQREARREQKEGDRVH